MAQTDIVFNISADTIKMVKDVLAAKTSLEDMRKASEALDRELKQAEKTNENFGFSTAKLSQQMDRLRMSYDPLYAASKRYEAAADKVERAHQKGAISASQYQDMLEGLANKYLRVDQAAASAGSGTAQMATGVGILGRMSSQTQGKLQQVGFQIQDFAVQVGAGTSAAQAFAQQFPQMAGAFGPWGVAIGTAAAILVPLGMAFMNATQEADKLSDAAKRQKDIIDELRTATEKLRIERQMASSGAQFEAEQQALNSINELMAKRAEVQQRLNQLTDVGGRAAGYAAEVQAKRDVLQAELQSYDTQIKALQNERNIEIATRRRANEMRQELVERKRSQDALEASMTRAYQLYARTRGEASALADETARAAQAFSQLQYQTELANTGQSSGPDAARTKVQFGGGAFRAPVRGAGLPYEAPKAGGGGGGNSIQAQLEALQQQLMTEEQIEMQSYAKRQEMLQQALDQRLLTQQQYSTLMEQAQQAHADKMSEIDVYRYGSGLDKATAFFGDMASAMQGGNERMQQISKKFAAAEALINAWRGFSQTMGDPTIPALAKIPMALKNLASGMSAVSALGGNGGRKASSAGSSSSSAAASSPLDVRLTGIGANDLFSGAQISSLLDRLSSEAGDRGYRLMVAQ